MRSAKSKSILPIHRSLAILSLTVLLACGKSSELDGGQLDAGTDAVIADSSVPPDVSDVGFDTTILDSSTDATDAASHPVRFRFGNATADPLMFCVQDFAGLSERVPTTGVLSPGEVTPWAERTRGFVRISWSRSDSPISEELCAGELGSSTSIFTDPFRDVTFALVGVDDEFAEACGATENETCRPYAEILRPLETVAPLFSSSPPRLRVLNGSVRGIDTACFAGQEYMALFGMPTFYESLQPLTDVGVGTDGCEDSIITWPFDTVGLAAPGEYWTTPAMATSATLALVDGEDGLRAVPWFDASCCD